MAGNIVHHSVQQPPQTREEEAAAVQEASLGDVAIWFFIFPKSVVVESETFPVGYWA